MFRHFDWECCTSLREWLETMADRFLKNFTVCRTGTLWNVIRPTLRTTCKVSLRKPSSRFSRLASQGRTTSQMFRHFDWECCTLLRECDTWCVWCVLCFWYFRLCGNYVPEPTKVTRFGTKFGWFRDHSCVTTGFGFHHARKLRSVQG